MKYLAKVGLILLFFSFLVVSTLRSQCTPDPNCIDELKPGEVCPEVLPDAVINENYELVVTIIPPYESEVNGYTVPLAKIIVADIGNIPPGMTYVATETEMLPYNSYCLVFSGTPTVLGEYDLEIKIIPFVYFGTTPVAQDTVVDDTSMSVKVVESSSVGETNMNTVFTECYPNPFSSRTQIKHYAISPGNSEIKIYNMLGSVIYQEIIETNSGWNYFNFSGSGLCDGLYLYKITDETSSFSGQFVKAN